MSNTSNSKQASNSNSKAKQVEPTLAERIEQAKLAEVQAKQALQSLLAEQLAEQQAQAMAQASKAQQAMQAAIAKGDSEAAQQAMLAMQQAMAQAMPEAEASAVSPTTGKRSKGLLGNLAKQWLAEQPKGATFTTTDVYKGIGGVVSGEGGAIRNVLAAHPNVRLVADTNPKQWAIA